MSCRLYPNAQDQCENAPGVNFAGLDAASQARCQQIYPNCGPVFANPPNPMPQQANPPNPMPQQANPVVQQNQGQQGGKRKHRRNTKKDMQKLKRKSRRNNRK